MAGLEETTEIGRVERMLTLRAFPGWASLPAPELATLASIARPRFPRKGSTVIGEGTPLRSLFLVVRGELQAQRSGVDLGRFGPGSRVGGLAAFARQTEGYSATATKDSVVLEIRVQELEEVFEDRFVVLEDVLRQLARQSIRLRRTFTPDAGFPLEVEAGPKCPVRRLDLVERIFYLQKNLAIEGRIDSMAVLAHAAEEVRLGPGETLWKTGDSSDHLVALLCGRVRGTSAEGHDFLLGAGDLVGSLDATAEVPRWYDCCVVDEVVGLVLPHDVALDVWEDQPDLALRLLEAFSRQVLGLLERRG